MFSNQDNFSIHRCEFFVVDMRYTIPIGILTSQQEDDLMMGLTKLLGKDVNDVGKS